MSREQARVALPIAGTIIGAALGSFFIVGTLPGAAIGGAIGGALGAALGPVLFPIRQQIVGPRLDDLRVQDSSYGVPIPWVWASFRLAGNVIWSTEIVEVENEESEGKKDGTDTSTFTYFGNWASLICKGPIDEVTQIYMNNKLVWDRGISRYGDVVTIHLGTSTQTADPLIESFEGAGNVPGYRNRAYVVFGPNFPLEDFGNGGGGIPNTEFVVNGSGSSYAVEWQAADYILTPPISSPTEGFSDREAFINERNVVQAWSNDGRYVYTIHSEKTIDSGFAGGSDGNLKYLIGRLDTKNGVITSHDVTNTDVVSDQDLYIDQNADDALVITQDGFIWWAHTINTPAAVEGFHLFAIEPTTMKIVAHHKASINPSGNVALFELKESGAAKYIGMGIGDTDAAESRILWFDPLGLNNLVTGSLTYRSGEDSQLPDLNGIPRNHINEAYFIDCQENGMFVMGHFFSGINYRLFSLTNPNDETADAFTDVTPWTDDIDGFARIETSFEMQYDRSLGYIIVNGEHTSAIDANYRIMAIDVTTPSAPTVAWDNKTDYAGDNRLDGDEGPLVVSGPSYGFTFGITTGDIVGSPTVVRRFIKIDNSTGLIVESHTFFESTEITPDNDPNKTLPNPPWPDHTNNVDGPGHTTNFYYIDPRVSSRTLWALDLNNPNVTSQAGATKYTFGTEGGSSVTLSTIVGDICDAVGITADKRDTSALTQVVKGYGIANQSTGLLGIEPLRVAYFFDGVDTDKLRFVNRGGSSVKTITHLDMQAYSGKEIPILLAEPRIQVIQLPERVTVTHLDESLDFQNNTQQAKRNVATISSLRETTGEIPIVLTADEGREAAERGLLLSWEGQTQYEFSTPLKHLDLEPGDIVTVTVPDEISGLTITHEIYLQEVLLGVDDILTFKGISEDQSIFVHDPNLTGTTPGYTPATIITPSISNLILHDWPLVSEVTDSMGHYASVKSDENWSSADIYISTDNSTFNLITQVTNQATRGNASTVLASGPTTIFDRTNTVRIQFPETTDSLTSVTELEVLNGSNIAMLGREMIGFATATLISSDPVVYELSTLLRGGQGTDHEVGGHILGDLFTLLQLDGSIASISLPLVERNIVHYYKAVSRGQVLADVTSIPFTPTGIRIKPLSPVHLDATWSGNDIVITWVERTRILGGWQMASSEPVESWELDFHDLGSPSLEVVSTRTSTTNSYTYTEAQQIADFGSAQTTIDLIVYQISNRVGRGYGSNTGLVTTFTQ